jgi:hypothetical protein
MFELGVETAGGYTIPIILGTRTLAGKCVAGPSSAVAVNVDGWFVTAKHIIEGFKSFDQGVNNYKSFIAEKQRIEAQKLIKNQRKQALRNLGNLRQTDVTNWLFLWGRKINAPKLTIHLHPTVDLALVRVPNYNMDGIEFPKFSDVAPSSVALSFRVPATSPLFQ